MLSTMDLGLLDDLNDEIATVTDRQLSILIFAKKKSTLKVGESFKLMLVIFYRISKADRNQTQLQLQALIVPCKPVQVCIKV